ncbi:MAG: LPXTG cell wall anchor domain-containing protein [Ruminococcus sp.]|nr:LPXTG cell wall anchor domain-containing protein [Ruminococcus sp.]
MKNFKKLASMTAALMIAATMVAGTGMVASAAPATSYKISVSANTESTFTIYQLLTGTVGEDSDGNKIIGNAQAGAQLAAGKTVEDVLEAVENATQDSDLSALVGNTPLAVIGKGNDAEKTGLAAGYYLVVEDNGKNQTANILKVVDKDVNIVTKLGALTFQKKLKDTNDTAGTITDWQDGADWDVGDQVPFQLKATLPENVSEYEGYFLKFTDNIAAGFYVNEVSDIKDLTVKIGGKTISANDVTGGNTGYDITVSENKFTIVFPDIKHVASNLRVDPNNAEVVVEYKAVLGEDSVTSESFGTAADKVNYGEEGNENTAFATYSNNPEFDMYPGVDLTDDDDTNDTPDDTDENDDDTKPKKPNDGGDDDQPNEENPSTKDDEDNDNNDSTGSTTLDKVKVFTYKTVINKVDENEDPLEGAEFTLYKDVDGTPVEITRVVVSGDKNDVFSFYGLDDGDYTLSETKTPDGYNTIADIDFTISATHDEDDADDPELIDLTATGLATDPITGDVATGVIESNIINEKGSVLPETGGIGTKIFYGVGGSMAGLAAVALIAKKRMSKKED